MDGDRRTITPWCLVGVVLADDEDVVVLNCGEACRDASSRSRRAGRRDGTAHTRDVGAVAATRGLCGADWSADSRWRGTSGKVRRRDVAIASPTPAGARRALPGSWSTRLGHRRDPKHSARTRSRSGSVGRHALDRERERLEDEPMRDDGEEQALDVGRVDVRPAVDQRPGARHPLEGEARADRGADADLLEVAGRPHQLDEPPQDEAVDVDLLDRARISSNSVRDHLAPATRADARAAAPRRSGPPDRRRVPERRLDREPVELRLRQRKRPLLLDRVLRREDEERVRRAVGSRPRSSPASPPSPRGAPTASSASRG